MIQVNGQANIWKNEIFSTGLKEYNYLYKLELKHALFASKNRNDHAHCELCWNKISGNETDIHDGYVDADRIYWICPDCYQDFKDLFHWTLSNTDMKKE